MTRYKHKSCFSSCHLVRVFTNIEGRKRVKLSTLNKTGNKSSEGSFHGTFTRCLLLFSKGKHILPVLNLQVILRKYFSLFTKGPFIRPYFLHVFYLRLSPIGGSAPV